ncbi:hypothetical protein SAMN06265368_2812 [Cohaesibacter gelatinilyticus]|uniref:Uncharacterized protein n=2 Tax=Cohaesibacter gelatinilyticus TaxID=372072 RepID=A0A285PD96_9HYPH|nr:hypothetical protein SAMN06265368_2812 [Cohaesibacter gelatinilyticus]
MSGECIQSQAIGTWLNPFAGNKSDITKLEIWEVCSNETVPHLKVKAYTACAPRDCTWGRSIAQKADEQYVEVLYRTFFAKRLVKGSINGKRMDVIVYDDFHDPRKSDQQRSFVLWKQ